ncbi:MAG: hypothetical protein ACXWLH_02045 [Candidatus Saccharimonadales bacterium]
MASTGVNPWNEVLGPFYVESGLQKHGISDTDGLIDLHTADGSVLYPHAQFDVLLDETLRRREKVIDLWNTLIRPAIDEGVVDEWTATGMLLQGTEENPSEAELITRDESRVERVAEEIAHALARFRQ